MGITGARHPRCGAKEGGEGNNTREGNKKGGKSQTKCSPTPYPHRMFAILVAFVVGLVLFDALFVALSALSVYGSVMSGRDLLDLGGELFAACSWCGARVSPWCRRRRRRRAFFRRRYRRRNHRLRPLTRRQCRGTHRRRRTVLHQLHADMCLLRSFVRSIARLSPPHTAPNFTPNNTHFWVMLVVGLGALSLVSAFAFLLRFLFVALWFIGLALSVPPSRWYMPILINNLFRAIEDEPPATAVDVPAPPLIGIELNPGPAKKTQRQERPKQQCAREDDSSTSSSSSSTSGELCYDRHKADRAGHVLTDLLATGRMSVREWLKVSQLPVGSWVGCKWSTPTEQGEWIGKLIRVQGPGVPAKADFFFTRCDKCDAWLRLPPWALNSDFPTRGIEYPELRRVSFPEHIEGPPSCVCVPVNIDKIPTMDDEPNVEIETQSPSCDRIPPRSQSTSYINEDNDKAARPCPSDHIPPLSQSMITGGLRHQPYATARHTHGDDESDVCVMVQQDQHDKGVDDNMAPQQTCDVWTDGAAWGSTGGRRAGSGAWFGPGDPRNAACRVPGVQTNNRAELCAVLLASRQRTTIPGSLCDIHVLADSSYVVLTLQRVNAPSTHLDMWRFLEHCNHRIDSTKVEGHAGIVGNECADRLSKFGAGYISAGVLEGELYSIYSKILDSDAATIAAQLDTEAAIKTRDTVIFDIERNSAKSARVPPNPFDVPIVYPLPAEYFSDPEWKAEPTADVQWYQQKIITKRTLKKSEFDAWVSTFLAVARGYSASDYTTRQERLEKIIDLPRTFLQRPQRRHGVTQSKSKNEKAQEPSDTHLTKRVIELLALNATGKATRAVAAKQCTIAPMNSKTIQSLQDLHHVGKTMGGALVQNTEKLRAPLNIEPAHVHRAIRKQLSRGAAPALDGWTRELFVPLAQNAEALSELKIIITDLLQNRIADHLRHRLCATSMTALIKPEGGIRPIAPESCWIKLASTVALGTLPEEATQMFAPFQTGVFGNVEQAVMRVRKAYAQKGILVAIDSVNAYNSTSRKSFLEPLFADTRFEVLWGITTLTYGKPSYVYLYEANKLVCSIPSVTGVRQGSVLGPILFSLALQPLLVEMAALHPNLDIIAYIDDVNLIGVEAGVAFEWFAKTVADRLQLQVNRDKTFALSMPGVGINWKQQHDIKHAGKCGKVLGGCMVADPYGAEATQVASEWCLARLKKQQEFFTRLTVSDMPKKGKSMILRSCGIPRANFMARVHEPAVTLQAMQWFDNQVISAWKAIHGVLGTELSAVTEVAIKLPVYMGGQGLRAMVEVRMEAYDSCLKDAKGDQKTQTHHREVQVQKKFLASLTAEERAINVSACAAHASRLLTVGALMPSDNAYIIAVKERCFIQVLANTTNTEVHTKTWTGGAKINRHNAVADGCGMALQRLDISVTLEPRKLMAGTKAGRRPDIIAVSEGARAVGDFCIVYPAAATYLPQAATTEFAAAMKRSQAKDQVWSEWCRARNVYWSALPIESTGAVPVNTCEWLSRLVRDKESALTITSAYDDIINAMLVEVYEGNADLFASTLGKPARKRKQLSSSSRVSVRLSDQPNLDDDVCVAAEDSDDITDDVMSVAADDVAAAQQLSPSGSGADVVAESGAQLEAASVQAGEMPALQ